MYTKYNNSAPRVFSKGKITHVHIGEIALCTGGEYARGALAKSCEVDSAQRNEIEPVYKRTRVNHPKRKGEEKNARRV